MTALPLTISLPLAWALLSYLRARTHLDNDLALLLPFLTSAISTALATKRDKLYPLYTLERRATSKSHGQSPFSHLRQPDVYTVSSIHIHPSKPHQHQSPLRHQLLVAALVPTHAPSIKVPLHAPLPLLGLHPRPPLHPLRRRHPRPRPPLLPTHLLARRPPRQLDPDPIRRRNMPLPASPSPPRRSTRSTRSESRSATASGPDVWDRFKTRFGVEDGGGVLRGDGGGRAGVVESWSSNALSAGAVGFQGTLVGAVMAFKLDERAVETKFQGYLRNEGATGEKILRDVLVEGDAWFSSGDVVRLDWEGRWFFVDRIGDTFRWKSENVSTAEVAECVGAVEGWRM
ncbi:hypothetical protein LTS18_006255 [Coniosporium uncinatum]|uniref:Uncharacterized protein n=1 Tax=Coniosporium uncinatum TaxID=93489 RepID=A0ACC3DAU1_9PEZI|nr:hypothetical protein LTS18_006255 [Coniosporium uncinatum]